MARHRRSVALEAALLELMRCYDRFGGVTPEVAGYLESAIERCLGERGTRHERAHDHLQVLLRARDLHQFIAAAPELVPLKVRICEQLLDQRDAATRWAAVRALLLDQLDALCEPPLPGLAANQELYKRHLSDPGSRLGALLVTVALFNLELEGEDPPPNRMLRFRRGHFPQHWWELCVPAGHTAPLGGVERWTPTEPLCRWEYLAADLGHAIYRRQQDAVRGRPWAAPAAERGRSAADAPDGAERLYGRFEADATGPAQLELFALDGAGLRAGLLRRIHKRHGPEGVKLLAVLCARLGTAEGPVQALSVGGLANEAGLGVLSARGLQQRSQRLLRVLDELAQMELTRVREVDGHSRAETGRLLTVLGRSRAWHGAGADAAPPATAQGMDTAAQDTVRVLTDPALPVLLGAAFTDLPPLLLEATGKDHPYLLPLYVWFRSQWSGADAAPIERTAQALLTEAGVWVSESGRYRAVEALKRDLEFLREQGWLGAWHLQRSEARDAMEDRYRLRAPGPSGRTSRGLQLGPHSIEGGEMQTSVG